MKFNYVYFMETQELNEYGTIARYNYLFNDLKGVVDFMNTWDLVFLDRDQIIRLKHGDSAAIRSKKKRKYKDNFTIGIVESLHVR